MNITQNELATALKVLEGDLAMFCLSGEPTAPEMAESLLLVIETMQDDTEPQCDHCGMKQVLTESVPWNGETGCHVPCEVSA